MRKKILIISIGVIIFITNNILFSFYDLEKNNHLSGNLFYISYTPIFLLANLNFNQNILNNFSQKLFYLYLVENNHNISETKTLKSSDIKRDIVFPTFPNMLLYVYLELAICFFVIFCLFLIIINKAKIIRKVMEILKYVILPLLLMPVLSLISVVILWIFAAVYANVVFIYILVTIGGLIFFLFIFYDELKKRNKESLKTIVFSFFGLFMLPASVLLSFLFFHWLVVFLIIILFYIGFFLEFKNV